MVSQPHQLQKLLGFFEKERRLIYKKGGIIIRPEDQPGGIYFIEHGFVKAYAITKYGEENLLIIKKQGEIFPLIWAFVDNHREIFYEAMGETVLLRSSREDFLKFVDENPDVMPVMLDMAIEMYRVHSERVNTLEYRTVRERVVSFLVTMASRFGVKTDEGIVLQLPLRQQDIAASINASRETTSRELTHLARKHLIAYDEYIVLRDYDGLCAIL
jgi:CRP/FNR family transcriptional regulator